MVAVVKKDKITGDALGTGRRKSSVARVRVRSGSGTITINKRPLDEFFLIEAVPGEADHYYCAPKRSCVYHLKRAIDAGIESVAFDRSGFKYHGRVKALADSARENGLKF